MVRVRVSVKVRVSVMVSLVGFRSSRPEFAGLCSVQCGVFVDVNALI